jgi:hypothetical protein
MKKLDQIIRKHLHSLNEGSDGMHENYMFFSNLEQIHRQCEMLLNMDKKLLDRIIQDGHDWADDHVSEAKNNMDQVFDFFMNKTKSEDGVEMNANMDSFSMNEDLLSEEYQIDESKNCPTQPSKWAASKAAAKAKFDVYPSAYANGWAAKNYKKKGGGWKKCKK